MSRQVQPDTDPSKTLVARFTISSGRVVALMYSNKTQWTDSEQLQWRGDGFGGWMGYSFIADRAKHIQSKFEQWKFDYPSLKVEVIE